MNDFVTLSILNGIGTAASQTAQTSIFIALYPTKVATVFAGFQSLFGFGYMIGKQLKKLNIYNKLGVFDFIPSNNKKPPNLNFS